MSGQSPLKVSMAGLTVERRDRLEVDVFFFSSRRRHTRYWRDWSSDVCSSDLAATATVTRGELIQSVSGSGQIKPAQDTSLNFSTSGIVSQVLVKEGQQVQQGATLDRKSVV